MSYVSTMTRRWFSIALALAALAPAGSRAAEPARKVGGPADLAGLEIFPPDNPWNTPVDRLPVHPKSATYLKSIGLDKPLHPDFGTVWNGAPLGIPYVVVPGDQPKVRVTFEYPDESDPGPYPVPRNAAIEGGPNGEGDRHVLVVDPENKKLYELFSAFPNPDGSWRAGSGAIFDLTSNRLRPEEWTSADAAGLPIFPGLVRREEVAAGEIKHAVRFTATKTRRAYIPPGTHFASRSDDPNLPPMGLRVRLRADYDTSGFPHDVQVILKALKKYGMILADNGGDWYISGAPDPKWDDDALHAIKRVKGSDLEIVDTGPASDEGPSRTRSR